MKCDDFRSTNARDAGAGTIDKAAWSAPRLIRIKAISAENGFTQEVKDGQFTRS